MKFKTIRYTDAGRMAVFERDGAEISMALPASSREEQAYQLACGFRKVKGWENPLALTADEYQAGREAMAAL